MAIGVRVGLLSFDGERYALEGLARALSAPENDATLALVWARSTWLRKGCDSPARWPSAFSVSPRSRRSARTCAPSPLAPEPFNEVRSLSTVFQTNA